MSKPYARLPPPVMVIPFVEMSATSSGVGSITVCMVSIMLTETSSKASSISDEVTSNTLGRWS